MVKDLNDRNAKDIDFTPTKKTVAELLQLPSVVPQRTDPRGKDERQTYRVICEIVKYKIENDGDIHLVIQDPKDPSSHMIAEIPDPACPDAIAGGHAAEFSTARDAVLAVLASHPPKARMQSLQNPPRVEIVGVGFYDFPHGQTGMASNDLEIHPILSLKPVK